MRKKPRTIPSAFTRFDDHVTSADEFANCRDLQTARGNHNILAARRVQQTIFTCAFASDHGTTAVPRVVRYTTFRSRLQPEQDESEILRTQIFVPQWTQQLRLRFDACKSELAEGSELVFDPIVYADVWNPYARKPIWPPPSIAITAANGTPTAYTIDINLPQTTAANTSHAGRRAFEFGVWVKCARDTTRKQLVAAPPTDVAHNSVTVAAVGNLVSDLLSVGTDAGIEGRQVVKQVDLGGGNYKLFLDQSFSRLPDAIADTVDVEQIAGVDIYSMSLRCLPVTSSVLGFAL